MKNDQLLLWKYIDGLCSPDEMVQVEAYLKEHPEKKVELDSRIAFDGLMKDQQIESPSMRFVQNVMEQTKQVQASFSESLLSPFAKWTFGGMMGVFFLLFLLSILTAGSPGAGSPEIDQLIGATKPVWSVFNSQMVLMLCGTSIAGVLYFGLDLIMSNRSNLSN